MSTVKVFMTNRSQAVRLPKDFQFTADEVLTRKVGDDVILSPRPRDWKSYLESAPVASDVFMADIEGSLAVQSSRLTTSATPPLVQPARRSARAQDTRWHWLQGLPGRSRPPAFDRR
jgi:antitoxin VapB